jgi:hypothetical protein
VRLLRAQSHGRVKVYTTHERHTREDRTRTSTKTTQKGKSTHRSGRVPLVEKGEADAARPAPLLVEKGEADACAGYVRWCAVSDRRWGRESEVCARGNAGYTHRLLRRASEGVTRWVTRIPPNVSGAGQRGAQIVSEDPWRAVTAARWLVAYSMLMLSLPASSHLVRKSAGMFGSSIL